MSRIIIKTASWFTPIPADHIKIGTSRGVPRGFPAGYRRMKALEPGDWFKSCTVPQYLTRYNAILAKLDPEKVAREIMGMAGDKIPVLVCFESAEKVCSGETWCHRHLVAKWLEDKLGIKIEEIGHPKFDRFAKLHREHVAEPDYH